LSTVHSCWTMTILYCAIRFLYCVVLQWPISYSFQFSSNNGSVKHELCMYFLCDNLQPLKSETSASALHIFWFQIYVAACIQKFPLNSQYNWTNLYTVQQKTALGNLSTAHLGTRIQRISHNVNICYIWIEGFSSGLFSLCFLTKNYIDSSRGSTNKLLYTVTVTVPYRSYSATNMLFAECLYVIF